MLLTHPAINFEDARGAIKDILFREPVDHVTVITSRAGVVRGNHYHNETVQWVYLASGSMKSLTRKGNGNVEVTALKPGDLILTEAGEQHALEALEDSTFFVFTRGPRGGQDYESDTFRLDEPLRDPAL
ncbi:MAG: cupin domain-containing protein [Alphaproteobacteria bacterium]|nr:cupin domain-containing protein [Alphaproteobacteria bacterium]